MKIGKYTIGIDHPPFIIAEMSGNHNQSIERAIEIIDAAAAAGAHAIKLQTYTADTITIPHDKDLFFIKDENSLWKGQSLYELYNKAHTPWEWHKPLFDHAIKKGIIPFSSPFDETAVDFLETLHVPAYKIASFENNHIPLLKKVAKTGKPVIVSTGLSNKETIKEAVDTLKENGCKNIVLLKCTSSYPASSENSNLVTIPDIRQRFQCEVGLSDHTMGIGAPIAAIALGARVIEKHFTLRRSDGGVDAAFSLEPEELKALVIESERAFLSLGKVSYDIQEDEKRSMQFKRSIYVIKSLRKGDVLTEKNIRIIRPGGGLHPRYFNDLLNKKLACDVEAGTPASWDMIANNN